MELPTLLDAVRKRPAMYVGGLDDGSGVQHMVLEVVANAYDQHLAGRCSTIEVEIEADGTVIVRDDGPGLRLRGGDGVPPLDVMLSTLSRRPTVDGHRPHVHLGLGGMGLFIVNALSERFKLVTVCDGVEACATFACGTVIEPFTASPTTRPSGTTVQFRPDPAVFRPARVPRVPLTRALEDLCFLTPNLTLRWRIAGDDFARAGLAARVALGVPCEVAAVASHRLTHEITSGSIDVEVALAWQSVFTSSDKPRIDSFVNLSRTRGDGCHVDGLVDGICTFFSSQRRTSVRGLVAAVSVILADVKYGNPTKDRLDSPEARMPVATATQQALEAWAATNPAAVAELRTRI